MQGVSDTPPIADMVANNPSIDGGHKNLIRRYVPFFICLVFWNECTLILVYTPFTVTLAFPNEHILIVFYLVRKCVPILYKNLNLYLILRTERIFASKSGIWLLSHNIINVETFLKHLLPFVLEKIQHKSVKMHSPRYFPLKTHIVRYCKIEYWFDFLHLFSFFLLEHHVGWSPPP